MKTLAICLLMSFDILFLNLAPASNNRKYMPELFSKDLLTVRKPWTSFLM
jgi:hypothetical protein